MELLLPELGENLTSGTVTKILVNVGDTINKGQNILELETDKAVLEVPSPAQGVVSEILIKNGAVIKVGQPIFKIQSSASSEPNSSSVIARNEETKQSNKIASLLPPLAGSARNDTPIPLQPSSTSVHMPVRRNVAAAPSVRLFAREIGIDIAQVPGNGPGGRISIDDVKKYAKALNTSRAAGAALGGILQPSLPDFAKWGSIRREAMNNVRRKTAQHLSSAWNTIAQVTQFDKADITELENLRKNLSTKERKLSITSFLIKIVAGALKKFPSFNASIDMTTHEIIYKDYINIGVAVDTDRGLLVPVIKNADRMTVRQISDELTAVAERARSRKTTIEEMQGGTFSVSNLGGIGGTYFTPIVNWPEVAILGVARSNMEPVYREGQWAARLMLGLSLSYDHRLIDGADGARFIRWICETIGQPSELDLKK
ncbi:MAG: 2-oxo acid dehydrogenase subunit E2 [Candidatus Omnitrophica bacterium]|nr:2-oxo acid dehydrogenase subunit E2 [Candidatus Omnitrophota bacterium]